MSGGAPERERGPVLALTGATGLLGGVVAAIWPGPLRVLVRDGWAGRRASVIRGDVGDAAAVGALVDGADVVVHCAGWMRDADPVALRRAHVDAARHLARSVTGRLVFVSALAATRPEHGPYSRSKADGERLIEDAAGRWVILRPGLLVGPGSQLERWLAAQRAPVVPVVGRARLRPLHVRSAAAACVAAALGTAGGHHALVGPEVMTLGALVCRIDRRRALPLPVWPCRAAARTAEALGLRLPVSLEALRAATTATEAIDPRAAAEALGFEPWGPGGDPAASRGAGPGRPAAASGSIAEGACG